ncbi:uncharacterized protein LOC125202558 [Salvia hispanica]|uniref:uncharacterized protein LOC125202558 n=1 Tax=Salvia hispanica TaxID=49212 RepID=UPI0020090108|nr:uncharacterized protein LOC125202558 [Salvia hispanica]
MRPTPSPSCSSPSSCGGRGGRITSPGCLSRILRRILCFSNLPLCSFDHFRADESQSPGQTSAPGSTPGVVARLMGLDSPVPRAGPVHEEIAANKLKTPVRRLRDLPPYQELEDDKFFILSFEKRRQRKSKKREGLEGKNKENENPEKSKRKMGKKYAVSFENEGDSENSSPNSVLEFLGYSADQESVSSGEISRLANSKTRRPLSEELESCGESNGKLSNDRVEREEENMVRRSYSNYYANIGGIGKLAAMEIVRTSWLHDGLLTNKHCVLEIGRDVASSILDHLLEELLTNIGKF